MEFPSITYEFTTTGAVRGRIGAKMRLNEARCREGTSGRRPPGPNVFVFDFCLRGGPAYTGNLSDHEMALALDYEAETGYLTAVWPDLLGVRF